MVELEGRTQNLLVFHLCGMDCAFPLESVREIVPMATLSCPPGLPSGLAGFLDLRGTAIPIVRLDRLFNLPEQLPGLHTPMIVLRGVLCPIGIIVESVRGIVPVAYSEFLQIPPGRTLQGCVTAGLQLDTGLVHVLSPMTLLKTSEDRMVADFSLMSQTRRTHLEHSI